MYKKRLVTQDTYYVGASERRLALFENVYPLNNGVSYNSYLILDEKTCLLDSVDKSVEDVFIKKVVDGLNGRKLDYLVVNHMEPDHAYTLKRVIDLYPEVNVVLNDKTLRMFKNFNNGFEPKNFTIVKEMDQLVLGKHTLVFIFAPMVHWPEVMVTYDSFDKVLFSADGFGKFGALDVEEDWADEARRYYIGIVGKYGKPVQALLKKASALDIQIICPLHGPILTENLGYYLNLYNTWSSYAVEEDGIVLAYTSVYGNTKKAVELLAEELKNLGCEKVVVDDLARCDMSKAVADAFRYGKLVLATLTYNGDVFPFMRDFIDHLTERSYQNRTIGLIENGSWAPTAAKVMKAKFEKSSNINFVDTVVTVKSALDDTAKESIKKLAQEIYNA